MQASQVIVRVETTSKGLEPKIRCVYIAQVEDLKFFIIVYVDDLILVCNNKDKLLQVKEKLSRKFEMKDLGDLHFFLGMEVERDHSQRLLYFNQIGYLKEILKRFRNEDCKAIEMPLDPMQKSLCLFFVVIDPCNFFT